MVDRKGCLYRKSTLKTEEIFFVVGSAELWETRSVFQGLWEGEGFPQSVRAALGVGSGGKGAALTYALVPLSRLWVCQIQRFGDLAPDTCISMCARS